MKLRRSSRKSFGMELGGLDSRPVTDGDGPLVQDAAMAQTDLQPEEHHAMTSSPVPAPEQQVPEKAVAAFGAATNVDISTFEHQVPEEAPAVVDVVPTSATLEQLIAGETTTTSGIVAADVALEPEIEVEAVTALDAMTVNASSYVGASTSLDAMSAEAKARAKVAKPTSAPAASVAEVGADLAALCLHLPQPGLSPCARAALASSAVGARAEVATARLPTGAAECAILPSINTSSTAMRMVINTRSCCFVYCNMQSVMSFVQRSFSHATRNMSIRLNPQYRSHFAGSKFRSSWKPFSAGSGGVTTRH
nr:uncharacterized protein LOC117844429 [Setaria viridis]